MEQTATPSTDVRKKLRTGRQRQGLAWGIFLILILILVSVFSGGFFIYSAVVVAILLMVAIGTASMSIVGIHTRRSVSRTEINLGETVNGWLTVENKKTFPAFWLFWQDHIAGGLDVEGAACHFKTIPAGQKHELKYTLHSTRRGLFRIGPTVVEAGGPFGLVRRFFVGPQVDFITVLPRVVPIGKGLALGQRPIHQVPRRRSIFEDPSRFLGMRDYRPGDSMRRIHWRATARSGKIQVKLFEPSVLTGVLLALDMGLGSYPFSRTHPGKIDPLLEFSITAAASLAQYVLAGDQQAGLISNGTDAAADYPEDWTGGSFHRLDQALAKTELRSRSHAYQPVEVPPAKGHWQDERLLTALARLVPSASVDLPHLLVTELPRLPRSLVLMVVTPLLDASLAGALESCKRSGIETGVIWVRLPDDQSMPGALPHNVPIYPVRIDDDLQQLGGQAL